MLDKFTWWQAQCEVFAEALKSAARVEEKQRSNKALKNKLCIIQKNFAELSTKTESGNSSSFDRMKLKSALTEMRTAWEYDISQLQSAISGISVARKKESAVFFEELKSAHRERRRALNNLLELRGNIRVLCRVRPISSSPSSEALQEAAETASGSATTRYEDPASSFMGPHGGTPGVVVDTDGMTIRVTSSKTGLERSWRFPRVFPLDVTQSEVFEEIEPMIHAVLDGYNATIFAYGQVRKSPSRNEQIFPFSDRSHLLMFQTHISLHNSRLELERPTPCRGTFRRHRRRL